MEQLRQVGEALGSVNALMAFADDLRINPRQCCLLADACALAFAAVAAEVRAYLRFHERLVKWKPLEGPLRELHRAVRDAEAYVRHCLEPRDSWWARAAALTHGADCVEQHLHSLLWSVAVVIEAVEAVSEATGSDPDELARRRLLLAKDYDRDMLEPRLFRQRLGGRYLATRELAARMDAAWKEDRWHLSQLLEERKSPASPEPLTRNEHRLSDLLTSPRGKVHPASLLLHGDFHVRRRLVGNLKEVQWMGETFAVKHFVGADADAVGAEVALLTLVAHPNVAHCRYCFHDEDKREFFLLMDELMTKDLASHIKEVNSAKRRIPFPLVVVVDAMLQIARGMEYLHSKKIYHGDLNPSNVLIKTRHADAHLHVKVAGFGPSTVTVASPRPSPRALANANANNAAAAANPCIWYAPEVLEQEAAKCSEKADVYSFAMICFELLTGKIPFEDNHLQGEHMSKNIRAGERPLFPFQAPKYLTNLTKRCWHGDPAQRPAFASICRVLRYVKRFLVLNPADPQAQPDAPPPVPPVDYLDIEANLLRRFPAWQAGNAAPRVSDVPFQMFAYRVVEKERTRAAILHIGRDKASDSSSDGNSLCGDENGSSLGAVLSDTEAMSMSSRSTARSLSDRSSSRASPRKVDRKNTSRLAGKLSVHVAPVVVESSSSMSGAAGTPQKSKSMGVVRQPQVIRRTQRIKSDGNLNSAVVPSSRRRVPGSGGGHASDSELA
ncbi:mitogen-activated protein kinase kinase kinase 7-like [Panicum virgatum]|uniref:mitogen-activated protein kinase kinase kinase 7-like n=1 Tax=Panicum virgatum TaxID=38727 RepID=UPI0019D66288|nr:mitogen-activated protein kinase kinase kinase 7-like [Panicum virgatum]